MTRRLRLMTVAALCLIAPLHARPDAGKEPFTVQALAEGVHLVRPADGDLERTNSVVVERADGLAVVGAQPTPAAARELLALIERRFSQPVRYLVLQHPHADASGGASAFPPSTLVVATAGFRAALAEPGYDFGGEAAARAGSSWTEPPRPVPVLVLDGNAVLEDARRALSLFPVAGAHTRGDLVVEIAGTDIVVAGSLLPVERNPYPADANLSGWIAALSNLAASGRNTIVPLRGAAVDARGVRAMRETFAWVRGEVDAAFVEVVPAEKIAERVLASARFPQFFDAAATPSFARQVVELAIQEARAQRRKFGLEGAPAPR